MCTEQSVESRTGTGTRRPLCCFLCICIIIFVYMCCLQKENYTWRGRYTTHTNKQHTDTVTAHTPHDSFPICIYSPRDALGFFLARPRSSRHKTGRQELAREARQRTAWRLESCSWQLHSVQTSVPQRVHSAGPIGRCGFGVCQLSLTQLTDCLVSSHFGDTYDVAVQKCHVIRQTSNEYGL